MSSSPATESRHSQQHDRGPDIARLVVMMPKLDGYEVTERLRGDPATRHMPVILLTARVRRRTSPAASEAGADDYVKKPFSTQELRDRVQAALGR
jgi:DNA-binding response OmpR family regulator